MIGQRLVRQGFFILLLLLPSVVAAADSVVIVVGSVAVQEDPKGPIVPVQNRKISLYMVEDKGGGSVLFDNTSALGVFALALRYQGSRKYFFLADEGDAFDMQPVTVPTEGFVRMAEKKDLRLRACNAPGGVSASDLGHCLVASAQRQQLRAATRVATAENADTAFQTRMNNLLTNASGWKDTDVQIALNQLKQPLAGNAVPPLPSIRSGAALATMHKVVASRERQQCNASSSFVSPDAALGDRCEGEFPALTAGEHRLVSLTIGEPRFDPSLDSIKLSWQPSDAEICVTAQPLSVDSNKIKRPRWRMVHRANPNDGAFDWNPARAREAGLPSDSMGYLVQRCADVGREPGTFVAVRVGDPPSQRTAVTGVVRCTSAIRDAKVTVTDVRKDGTKHDVPGVVVRFPANDERPRIWFDIPPASGGPGKYQVNVQVLGRSASGSQAIPFSFAHD